jgi:hypothetical protein
MKLSTTTRAAQRYPMTVRTCGRRAASSRRRAKARRTALADLDALAALHDDDLRGKVRRCGDRSED